MTKMIGIEMLRTTLVLVFLFVISLVTFSNECHAQRFRGLFRKNQMRHSVVQPNQHATPSHVSQAQAKVVTEPATQVAPQTVFAPESYFADQRHPVISRWLDGRMSERYRNPFEVDSRYIGGFHQSHFDNLGLPHGDIGLRGNALNWRTW